MATYHSEVPALRSDGLVRHEILAGREPASVLVVDDHPDMLESIAAVVADMGLRVVIASSGREALRQLLLGDFALILLDVNMPVMDGFETAALIRGRPRSAHVPIIFVTAEARGDEERFRGYNLGAVDFIYSPILPEILRAKVQVFADLFYLNRQRKHQAEELQRRSEEITSKNNQLEAASRAKSEFLANMSHELRTPLNAIIGFAEVLKDGLGGQLSQKQLDYVGEIFDSGQHLLALINDILDLSKVEAGRMELDTEALDVAGLLQGCLSVVTEKALKHRIALLLDRSRAPSHIIGDARKLKQIVYNLLSNAVKFTPDGGQVRVSARAVQRDGLGLAAPAGMAVRQLPLPDNEWREFLEIQVSDSGIGIANADLDRLFQAFLQLDGSLDRNFEGTGLGLALVQRMVALHGGTVAVASAPDRGSCFTVWLPCRMAADSVATSGLSAQLLPRANSAAATGGAVAAAAPAKRALVIEDNSQAANLLRLHLESAGFRVTCAPDAERGLELAASERPDLITLDLLLPGMGGFEALERLKADSALADVPVVIASVIAEQSSGFVLGAAKVLQKPLRRSELLAALRELGLVGKAHKQCTILAVDDDPQALELLASHLSKQKRCTLLRAGSGREAIAQIRQAMPDLLILDLIMSGGSGFDLVEALKADPATATLPILILTAKEVTAADRQRLNGHVLKIVEKSGFDGEHFLAEVRRALGGR